MAFYPDPSRKSKSCQIKVPLLNETEQATYDPYKIPPDISMALNHGKAKKVARQNLLDFCKICPCCNMLIEGTPLKLNCKLDDLAFLGCAYPFYFYFIKQVLLILCMLLFLGGSFKLLLINQDCNEKCITFFGFGIWNLKPSQLSYQMGGQSWMDTIISLLMIICTLYAKQKCFEAMKKYNDWALSPSQYTLMVQNFPRNATSRDIEEYFQEITKSKVYSINMAYDISEYKRCFNRKLKVCSEIYRFANNNNLTPATRAEMARLLLERGRLDLKLEEFVLSCEQEDSSSKSTVNRPSDRLRPELKEFTGTAFITFNDQAPIKVILENWGVTYLRTMKYLFFGDKWKMNPYLKFKGNTILVHNAPDPSDVIWENLDFSFLRNFHNNIIMYFLAGMLLFVSFRIQFETVKLVIEIKNDILKNEGTFDSFIIRISALAVSTIIILINFLLKLLVYYFTCLQRHYSVSKFNEYYLNVYILLIFFNSALMPYLVNTFINNESSPEQLLWDIHFILLTNAFSPALRLADPFLWYRMYMQQKILKEGSKCDLPQFLVNSWFEGPELDMAENYAFVVRTLLLCSWYSSVAPLGLIFSMGGLVFGYWLDKIFLLRINCYPNSQNESVVYRFVNNLEILPYLYIFGAIEYQYRVIKSQELMDFIWGFIVYGVTSGAMTLCLMVYYVFFKKKWISKNPSKLKYEDVRFLFLGDFERCNPLTQNQASRKFLEEIQNARSLSPTQKKQLLRHATMSIRKSKEGTKTFIGLRKSPSIGMPGVIEDVNTKEFEMDDILTK